MDADGLMPEDLESKLRQWDAANSPRPCALYVIPTGQNPTGVTQPAARRKAIHQVAERHDLIIIEDDPYYFLQLEPERIATSALRPIEYLRKLPPSYLSLDTSGRVIRLDTVSKILAPGLRLGWITGSSQLVAKFLNHTEFSTTSPSGPSQVMMYKLLEETWGHTGFVNWLMYLSSQYSRRLHTMVRACRAHLPRQHCRWSVPTFGMFVWIEIDCHKHRQACCSGDCEEIGKSCLEIEDRLYQKAKQNGVQISKGSWFEAKTDWHSSVNFRLTFAAASEEDLEEAVIRLGKAVRRQFLINDIVEMDRPSCDVSGSELLMSA